MVALLFCPVKGNVKYPPLSISLLSAYLKKNGIASYAFDINKSLCTEKESLSRKLTEYFAYPTTFSDTSNNIDIINNIDTIYNFPLFLSLLQGNNEFMNEAERLFVEELNIEIEYRANQLIKSGCKYFGFSVYVSNIVYSCILAKKLREKNPEFKFIFGGTSTAYAPIREFLLNMGIADFVVVGEGENAIVHLIQDLEGMNLTLKYNTIYSSNIAPSFLKDNELSIPVVSDLDTLPFPDFSSFDINSYSPDNKNYNILPIVSSRGCINQCAYCSETQYWQRFRQRSVDSVIQEIEIGIEKYNAKAFFFHDSLINGNIKWLEKFCEKIIEKNINVQWFSYASIQNLNHKVMQKMQLSGCVRLTFGIEHISEKVLRKMNKPSSLEKAKKALESSIELGIMPIANVIYGFQEEDDEDFINLLYFVSLPQFTEKVHFTFRPFEIRVGSTVTNKIIEDMQDISVKNNDFSAYDNGLQEVFNKINICWLPNKNYISKTTDKTNILKTFFRAQETTLNTQRSIIHNYDIVSILRSIITLDAFPLLTDNAPKTIENIQFNYPYIQQEIIIGAMENISLSEIRDCIYQKINFDESDKIDNLEYKIGQTVMKNAIILTQKNILQWK